MPNETNPENDTRVSSLDLSETEMREIADRAVTLALDYFSRVSELPIFPPRNAQEISAALASPLPKNGPDELDEIFDDCRRIFENSRHSAHPRFFGYVASPPTAVGAFADLIASTLNQNLPAWRSAPAATHIELTTVRWLAEMIGYVPGASGLLTSGGSMANLNALYIAHRTKTRGENLSRNGILKSRATPTAYVSDQAHHSIAKAADILGLGRDQVRAVESDERFQMNVARLREKILEDLQHGFQPFFVSANAGTVNTGAIDPLDAIAEVAKEFGLWFHIDGAYGAPAALVESKRKLFAGIDRADSIALDPHKWLYTPVDCGCLLLREMSLAHAAWTDTEGADYIRIFERNEEESFAFFDHGIELSRRFRALKLWMMLRYYGVPRIGAAIAEDCALANYLAEKIEAADDFELLAPVDLSICCFRYVPKELRNVGNEKALNESNERIVHAVQRGGRAYISNAILRGKFALRICITNFRTTRHDLDLTLEIIRDAAAIR